MIKRMFDCSQKLSSVDAVAPMSMVYAMQRQRVTYIVLGDLVLVWTGSRLACTPDLGARVPISPMRIT